MLQAIVGERLCSSLCIPTLCCGRCTLHTLHEIQNLSTCNKSIQIYIYNANISDYFYSVSLCHNMTHKLFESKLISIRRSTELIYHRSDISTMLIYHRSDRSTTNSQHKQNNSHPANK